MSNLEGHFEKTEHQLLDARVMTVPLYVDGRNQLTNESSTLLRSVELVGTQLGQLTLEELVDQVGSIVASPDAKSGLIIEDEGGIGSVTVAPEVTTVTIRKQGRTQIPSSLFFDMLYTWASYEENKTS